jgi:selenocysteine lyase/cysteine desulfurase
MAHRTIGTFPRGAVRVSPGYFTDEGEIDKLLEVLKTIAGG